MTSSTGGGGGGGGLHGHGQPAHTALQGGGANPHAQEKCDAKTIQHTCSLFGLDLERPPPLPPSRSYTVTGNSKLGYPQTRIMKSTFPGNVFRLRHCLIDIKTNFRVCLFFFPDDDVQRMRAIATWCSGPAMPSRWWARLIDEAICWWSIETTTFTCLINSSNSKQVE